MDDFTIQIYVPDGVPEGIRLISRPDRPELGIVFPRYKWAQVKLRREIKRAGVYILAGYPGKDDLPSVYVGHCEDVRNRIDTHDNAKDFWDWGVVFISKGDDLNRVLFSMCRRSRGST